MRSANTHRLAETMTKAHISYLVDFGWVEVYNGCSGDFCGIKVKFGELCGLIP